MTYNLTFNGIPIVFDENMPQDTFYIVSNSLDAERQRVLDRILTAMYWQRLNIEVKA